jgi:hypothetical protein
MGKRSFEYIKNGANNQRLCGQGIKFCAAPDCQFRYGPACDANSVPAGSSTSTVARTHVGSIPYGGNNAGGVQDCIKSNMIALTFDDGPYIYTEDLLNLLDKYNAKATFLISQYTPFLPVRIEC